MCNNTKTPDQRKSKLCFQQGSLSPVNQEMIRVLDDYTEHARKQHNTFLSGMNARTSLSEEIRTGSTVMPYWYLLTDSDTKLTSSKWVFTGFDPSFKVDGIEIW